MRRKRPAMQRGAVAAVLLAVALGVLSWRGAAAAPAADPSEVRVTNGGEFGAALQTLASPGPPVTILLAVNISMTDVPSAHPVRVARNVTIHGIGRPEQSEINLDMLVNAWELDPGVGLTLRNLTLSNLATRPPSAQPPPPQNMSVFTFPLWFFETNRRIEQITVSYCRLVIPYDEFLVVHHVMVEWEMRNPNSPVDMYTYFEDLMRQNLRQLVCDCEGMLYTPRGEVHIEYAAGLGLEMNSVDLQYKRNVFDVASPRSNISASNPAFSGSMPAYPESQDSSIGLIPGWAVALIVIGSVLFVVLTMLAIAGPRRLGHCLLGELPGGKWGPGGGGGDSDYILPTTAPRTASRGGRSTRALLAGLLPTTGGGGGVASSSQGMGDQDAEGAALEAGEVVPARRKTGKTVGWQSVSAKDITSSRSAGSSGAGTGGTTTAANTAAPPREDTALDQLHAAVAELNREINDKSLIIHEVLGQGAYGTVYRGTWRNLPVAVKTVVFQDRACGSEKAQKRAITEAAITSSVSHPNVVATLSYDLQPLHTHGAGMTTGNLNLMPDAAVQGQITDWKLFLVQEYCNGGSLRQAVDGRRVLWDSESKTPLLREIVTIALDVACGMEHLHTKHIVHGDLTPNNVLLNNELVHLNGAAGAGAGGVTGGGVTGDGLASSTGTGATGTRVSSPFGSGGSASLVRTAKIADFGLSIKMPEGASHVSNMRQGTPFYVAPEVLRRGNMTKASDIYSFGVLLWEMYHCKPPYKRSGRQGFVLRRGFPYFAESAPPRYTQLATACMAQMPRARPSFSQIKQELLDMLQAPEDLAIIPMPPAAAAAHDGVAAAAAAVAAAAKGATGGGGGGGLVPTSSGGASSGPHAAPGAAAGPGSAPAAAHVADTGDGAGGAASRSLPLPGTPPPSGASAPVVGDVSDPGAPAVDTAAAGAAAGATTAAAQQQREQEAYYQLQQERLRGLEAHMEQQRLQLQALQQQQAALEALRAQQAAMLQQHASSLPGSARQSIDAGAPGLPPPPPAGAAGDPSAYAAWLATMGAAGAAPQPPQPQPQQQPPQPPMAFPTSTTSAHSGTSGSAMAEASPEYQMPIELRQGFLTAGRRPSVVMEEAAYAAALASATAGGASGRLPTVAVPAAPAGAAAAAAPAGDVSASDAPFVTAGRSGSNRLVRSKSGGYPVTDGTVSSMQDDATDDDGSFFNDYEDEDEDDEDEGAEGEEYGGSRIGATGLPI